MLGYGELQIEPTTIEPQAIANDNALAAEIIGVEAAGASAGRAAELVARATAATPRRKDARVSVCLIVPDADALGMIAHPSFSSFAGRERMAAAMSAKWAGR